MKRLRISLHIIDRFKAFFILTLLGSSLQGAMLSQGLKKVQNEADSLLLILNGTGINEGQFLSAYNALRSSLKNSGSNRDIVDLSLDMLNSAVLPLSSASLIRSKAYADVSGSYIALGIIDSATYYATAFNLFLDEVEKGNGMQGYPLLNERLSALNALATAYGYKGNVEECVLTLEKAIALIEKTDVDEALDEYPEFRYGHVYTLYAIVQENVGEYQNSEAAYLNASKEAEALGDLKSLAEAKFFYARSLARRQLPNSYLVVDLVHEIDIKALSWSGLVTPWKVYELFTSLYSPGLLNIPDSVKYYSNKALESVLQTDDYSQIADTYWGVVKSARELKDWHWAYVNYELMAGYDMQILRSSKERNIGRLENQLESEREKMSLETELASQRSRKTIFILGGIALILINVFMLRSLRLSKKTRRLENLEQTKLQSDMEIEELKREKLHNILEFKNRQLATTTLSKESMNSQMTSIMEKLMEVEKLTESDSISKELGQIIRGIRSANNLQNNWAQFYKHFDSVHPNFFNKLVELNYDLTQNELRHCAYVLMNLTNKEVANMYGISDKSVKKARWRLKIRLNLEAEDSLQDFIYRIASSSSFIKKVKVS